MKVDIVSRKVVKPSIPTPITLREYKFSIFDQLSPQAYPGMLILYPKCPHIENVEMCNRLEISLSESLHNFYPLAGVFLKNVFIVNCNDRGVEVTRALVDGDLDDAIIKGKLDTIFLDSFVPPTPQSEAQTPILTIQLSLFSCGGLGLGFRIFHSICDIASVGMFLNHWSDTNHLGIHQSAFVPSFNLSSVFPQRKLVGLKPGPTNGKDAKKLVTKSFLFSASMISSLREEAAGGTPQAPSRVLVVTAHIWRTLIRISKSKHGHSRPSAITIVMNLRRTSLSKNLPPNSWGTFVSHLTARLLGDECMIGLNGLVNLLNDAIRKNIEEFSRAQSEDEVFTKLIAQSNETHGDHNPLIGDLFRVTSWSGFPFYEAADFGWGKPSWFCRATLPIEMVSLIDTREGDGFEAWVSLNEEDMVEFQRHFLNDRCKISEARKSSKL